MEDWSTVYKWKAKITASGTRIRGFNWLPSLPDLNPIERVWRYMKEESKKLPYVVVVVVVVVVIYIQRRYE